MIIVKRKAILSLFSTLKVDKPVLLPLPTEELRSIFFDERSDNNGSIYYKLNENMLQIRDKIDYSNMDFTNVDVRNQIFSRMFGVKINPQLVYNKSLENTTLAGVTFIGNDHLNEIDLFEEVKVSNANFSGSKGARINPQTIHDKDLSHVKARDVDFTGFSFDGAQIWNTDFTGSKGAVINPNKTRNTNQAILRDVTLLDLFEKEGEAVTTCTKNYQELVNKQMSYSDKILELILDQLPPQVEETTKEIVEQPQEPPKQKEKLRWFR